MDLQPHQQRVVEEKSELADRLQKLQVFVGSKKFKEVAGPERGLLLEQMHHMTYYYLTLKKRTDLWVANEKDIGEESRARPEGPA